MSGVLDQTTMTSMRYRLFDAGPIGRTDEPPTLLFDSAQSTPGAPKEDFPVAGERPRFDAVLPLELPGRPRGVRFSAPQRGFVDRAHAGLPLMGLPARPAFRLLL